MFGTNILSIPSIPFIFMATQFSSPQSSAPQPGTFDGSVRIVASLNKMHSPETTSPRHKQHQNETEDSLVSKLNILTQAKKD